MATEALSRHFESETDKVSTPHFDPLVTSARTNKFIMKQILIDTGSSINLITLEIFDKLRLDKKKNLSRVLYSLVGLDGKSLPIIGVTNLTVVMGMRNSKKRSMLNSRWWTSLCYTSRFLDGPSLTIME